MRHGTWSGIDARTGLRLILEWMCVFKASENNSSQAVYLDRDEFPERAPHALRLLWVLLALAENVGSR